MYRNLSCFVISSAKQWRDSDWMCTDCDNHNYASRSQCNRFASIIKITFYLWSLPQSFEMFQVHYQNQEKTWEMNELIAALGKKKFKNQGSTKNNGSHFGPGQIFRSGNGNGNGKQNAPSEIVFEDGLETQSPTAIPISAVILPRLSDIDIVASTVPDPVVAPVQLPIIPPPV
ncbi:hypothetical protein GIB67_014882 [Kingdonia uniflora]|uniref:RanBP2-type domain-containing protein n=1 Tax=Kingdonia uniflora TaxID=39325 RepID=A0A7J7MTS4_9MAGN|nr:hypothetical protein GIB67_014882 [Kingdonia uniflora]